MTKFLNIPISEERIERLWDACLILKQNSLSCSQRCDCDLEDLEAPYEKEMAFSGDLKEGQVRRTGRDSERNWTAQG